MMRPEELPDMSIVKGPAKQQQGGGGGGGGGVAAAAAAAETAVVEMETGAATSSNLDEIVKPTIITPAVMATGSEVSGSPRKEVGARANELVSQEDNNHFWMAQLLHLKFPQIAGSQQRIHHPWLLLRSK